MLEMFPQIIQFQMTLKNDSLQIMILEQLRIRINSIKAVQDYLWVQDYLRQLSKDCEFLVCWFSGGYTHVSW